MWFELSQLFMENALITLENLLLQEKCSKREYTT